MGVQRFHYSVGTSYCRGCGRVLNKARPIDGIDPGLLPTFPFPEDDCPVCLGYVTSKEHDADVNAAIDSVLGAVNGLLVRLDPASHHHSYAQGVRAGAEALRRRR